MLRQTLTPDKSTSMLAVLVKTARTAVKEDPSQFTQDLLTVHKAAELSPEQINAEFTALSRGWQAFLNITTAAIEVWGKPEPGEHTEQRPIVCFQHVAQVCSAITSAWQGLGKLTLGVSRRGLQKSSVSSSARCQSVVVLPVTSASTTLQAVPLC